MGGLARIAAERGAARRWTAGLALLAAAPLAGCAVKGWVRPAQALPLAAHHELTEVVVAVRSEGPLPLAPGDESWDGAGAAGLHEALGRAVVAETRGLGGWKVTTAPPDAPAAPPPGVAWVEVRLLGGGLTPAFRAEGMGDWDAPAILSARFDAAVTAGGREGSAQAGEAFLLLAPEALPRAAWAADGGAAANAALERLVVRAARRVAGGLLATAADGPLGPWNDGCGPEPRREPREAAPHADRRAAWARWQRWAPALPGGAAAEITYDLRAWRLEPWGPAVPVLAVEGLSQLAAPVSPPDGPAGVYGWAVRGVARLADGRRVASPWSMAPDEEGRCAPEPDPWRSPRSAAEGPSAAPAPPAGPAVSTAYLPETWKRPREGLGPRLDAGTGAAEGVKAGAGAGLQLSAACGPFFPVCAVVAVPGGAALGLTTGLLIGGINSGIRSTSATVEAGLAPEPLRTALTDHLAEEAASPALATAVERAARGALGEAGTGLRLLRLEAALVGAEGAGHPARLRLSAAGTLERPGEPAASAEATVLATAFLDAREWLVDGASVLAVTVRAMGPEAGRRLAAALAPPPEPAAAPPAAPAPAADPEARVGGTSLAPHPGGLDPTVTPGSPIGLSCPGGARLAPPGGGPWATPRCER